MEVHISEDSNAQAVRKRKKAKKSINTSGTHKHGEGVADTKTEEALLVTMTWVSCFDDYKVQP